MSHVTRRTFLEESMIATGIALASQAGATQLFSADSKRTSPHETIRHAVIGCRIRGRVHAREFARLPGVQVVCLCDPDSQLTNELANAVEEQTGRRPAVVPDLRTVFDDKSIDTVSIAAPNHWHALAAIWAMQAEKDVYVEKPVSHNVSEGRRIVQVARLTKRICQAGTQNRSRGDLAAAAAYIGEGKLGEIKLARTIVYGRRGSIGLPSKHEVPAHIDFNLWLGPGTQEKIRRPKLHYDWHWVWDTGNGELGNNNIHYIDICRWLLGLEGLGESVFSIGGRLGYEDAGETPNTQMVVHSFRRDARTRPANGGLTIIQEVRGLASDPFSDKFKAGHVIHGSEGFIAEGTLFDLDGSVIKTFQGPSVNHFQNFIEAVRSRRPEDLNADILEGHQSSALCHVGNISYRLGRMAMAEAIADELEEYPDNREVLKSFLRMRQHLHANGVHLKTTPLRMGSMLRMASDQEVFVGSDAANSMLARDYRRPFVVPSETEIRRSTS